ncbi:hypothetical protein [uncultured Polaribacter sp.]|jgi:hypothetical protein|uniref:hypothetical protein n=1 Tax=uncultured Polaribacter sp. TaxID=174711 RepID=UPI0037042CFA|tara:strand:- start:257 stop:1120 length:864 start_codon:yes stop_codon:yes gene_type:complete
MKNIKILSILFLSIAMTFMSCEDSDDSSQVDFDIVHTEGVVTTLSGTSGQLLGNASNPLDLVNSTVVLTDANAELTINLALQPGSFAKDVSKYQIVKSFKGGAEVVVAETTSLPYAQAYSTVAEFLDGLGLAASDLRIGDQIDFRVKVFTTTGNIYYQGSSFSKYSVTINCASSLAGAYSLVVQRDNGADVIFPNEIITEVSPGYYKTSSIYRWAVGSIAPDQGFNFNDVCGTLNAPQQGLAQGYYSNSVYSFADGSADPTTGELIIYYIVEFGSGPVENIATYTKL